MSSGNKCRIAFDLLAPDELLTGKFLRHGIGAGAISFAAQHTIFFGRHAEPAF